MVLEGYISKKLCGLPDEELQQIKTTFKSMYPSMKFDADSIKQIIGLMQSDKKNSHGRVKFVLLKSIGHCQMDVEVQEEVLIEAFKYYSV
jgi:3-dehydroquinate synthase